ncbi:MAG: diguanylate cyclase domain-containing protein [Gammaproteobacteria bacterium]
MKSDKSIIPSLKAVLIIDDDELFLTLLKTFCAKLFPEAAIEQFNPMTAGAPPADFDWSRYDLLFLDYDLGRGENGLDWLRRYKSAAGFPATIMLTAKGGEELAVEAMRFGVLDYINKEKVSMARLEESVMNALQRHKRETLLATTQTLQTTLYNKIHFYKKLKAAISNHTAGKHAFLLQIQVDNYGEIYEDFGLLIADNFISHMAREIGSLASNKNHTLNITRIGDALIACLVTDHANGKGGEDVAGTICDMIRDRPFPVDDKRIASGVSIGIVPVTATDSADSILLKADQACRYAQDQGGNTWSWYAPDAVPARGKKTARTKARAEAAMMPATETPAEPGRAADVEIHGAQEVVAAAAQTAQTGKPAPARKHVIDVAEAIKQNLIQANFRPFVALSDSATQFEADLFQLRTNVIDIHGDAVPQEELTMCEFKSGNAGMLDLWAARFALSQLLGLQKIPGLRKRGLFIRIFDESLADNKLYDWIKNLLAKIKVPNVASTIIFEINPPAFLQHKKNAMNFIAQMRDAWGMGFALYDVVNIGVFETCQKQAGFEFLEVSVAQKDTDLIAGLAESARAAGALTILENISDAQQLNLAIENRFDYGQGDFIQPPQDKLDNASEVIQI